jgi:hypothetical protein
MEKDRTEVILDQADQADQADQEDQVQPKKLSALEHFYARMRMPIGSSLKTVPITEDVRKDIERYKLEIEERHRNNTY